MLAAVRNREGVHIPAPAHIPAVGCTPEAVRTPVVARTPAEVHMPAAACTAGRLPAAACTAGRLPAVACRAGRLPVVARKPVAVRMPAAACTPARLPVVARRPAVARKTVAVHMPAAAHTPAAACTAAPRRRSPQPTAIRPSLLRSKLGTPRLHASSVRSWPISLAETHGAMSPRVPACEPVVSSIWRRMQQAWTVTAFRETRGASRRFRSAERRNATSPGLLSNAQAALHPRSSASRRAR